MKKHLFLHVAATACLTLTQSYAVGKSIEPVTINNEARPPYTENIVHYADEYNVPHHPIPAITDVREPNNLLTLGYDTMHDLDPDRTQDVEGSLNHHADPLGALDEANYMMMVPKGSTYVTIRKIRDGNHVKKINLPFFPRSADAYNKEHDLVFLNSRDRPAGVLINATSLKIVGKAGFNILCNTSEPIPIDPANVYADNDYYNDYDDNVDYDDLIKCKFPDFGGDQISGHPIWLSSEEFVLIDRANRLLHVYKIEPDRRYRDRWNTVLVQTIQTSSSLHQLIPEDSNNPNNGIFYGMTEGSNEVSVSDLVYSNITPSLYKYKFSGGRLHQIGHTELEHHPSILDLDELFDVRTLDRSIDKSQIIEKAQELKQKVYDDLKGKEASTLLAQDITSFIRLLKITATVKGNGGHNLYITPEMKHLYAPVNNRTATNVTLTYTIGHMVWIIELPGSYKLKGGVFVVDTSPMNIYTQIRAGNGAGHVAFSEQERLAVITNHKDNYVTAIDYDLHEHVKDIDLPFDVSVLPKESAFVLKQSHSQHISEDGLYYYNFWTYNAEGAFFRINLDTKTFDDSTYVGGIPIQGNFYKTVATGVIPPPAIEDGYNDIFPGIPFMKIDSNESANSSNGYDK